MDRIDDLDLKILANYLKMQVFQYQALKEVNINASVVYSRIATN